MESKTPITHIKLIQLTFYNYIRERAHLHPQRKEVEEDKSDMAEMNLSSDCWPIVLMVAIEFAMAVANVLLKKVLDLGMVYLVLITYRTSIAAIFLAPIAFFCESKSRPKLTPQILCYLFLSALIGATLTQYFYLLGMQYTSATFACAFINMTPAITFMMALPFRLETLDMKSTAGRAKLLGTLVCVGGAMVLTLYRGIPLTNLSNSRSETNFTHHVIRSRSVSATHGWTVGSLALVAGSLVWSSWFLVQEKISKIYPCQYSSTAFMNFFSALQSVILAFIIHRDVSVWFLHGKIEISTVLIAGMVGSGLCFVGMSWCVKQKGPLFTAAFSPLIQIIVAMFDFAILHEQLHLGSILGSVFVILGLYILLWGKNKEAKALAVDKPVKGNLEEGKQEQH